MEELEGVFGRCQSGVCVLGVGCAGCILRILALGRQKTEEEEVIEDLRESS